ncbi:AbiV family abortive infection protein [Capnocytophaga leadbetteri]|uniref:AbiV family abortive infection protein n=1 Tax=Capnocytophaga leadbetteri TaxID=327575 RepID=UPI0028EA933C|nr:AbiV family abortive infection protein [Capnocytophaga leadbetteri]
MEVKEKYLRAIYLTNEHSKELFNDAEFLYKNNKKERAYTFYHFSFEEAGRLFILAKAFYNCILGEIGEKDLNYKYLEGKGYQKHIEKLKESTLKMFIIPFLKVKSAEDEKVLLDSYDQMEKDISRLNSNKNKSIYIHFEGNDFKSPKDLITNDDLEYIRSLAELQLINIENLLNNFPKIGDNLDEYKRKVLQQKKERESLESN